jgi:hypothetical protein
MFRNESLILKKTLRAPASRANSLVRLNFNFPCLGSNFDVSIVKNQLSWKQ